MFEKKYFENKRINPEKLVDYGFMKENDRYEYATDILGGELKLFVFIAANGEVSTNIYDTLSNEEYLLYKVEASLGSYVGNVRNECENVLSDISQKCFDADIFRFEQALAVINYVKEKYGDELEFLWEKFPNCAAVRRKDDRKWYGLIFSISKKKLGLSSDETVEAIDLRLKPELVAETVDNVKYFPGWHMNKKSWYTMILDGSVPLEELCRRIDDSYELAGKQTK